MATSIASNMNLDKDSTPIAAQTTSKSTRDDSPRDLWCLIEGDTVIPVSVAANKSIAFLKELVYAKGKSVAFAKDLELLRVSDILEYSPNLCSFS